jgi:sugar lactone lactonase YvrE
MDLPEIVADYVCHNAENPLWHPIEQRLYWTDIYTGRLFRYEPATNTHEQIFRYAPDGTEVLRIPFPALKVSSVTFGGADYTDIYVTTAGGDNRPTEGEGAGAVFRLNQGVRGVPEFFSKISIYH